MSQLESGSLLAPTLTHLHCWHQNKCLFQDDFSEAERITQLRTTQVKASDKDRAAGTDTADPEAHFCGAPARTLPAHRPSRGAAPVDSELLAPGSW